MLDAVSLASFPGVRRILRRLERHGWTGCISIAFSALLAVTSP